MKAFKINPRVVVKSPNHSLRFTRRNLTNSVQNNNNNNNNFKSQGTSNANTQSQSPPAAGGFDPRIPSSSPSSTASNLDQGSGHSSSVKREFQEQQPSSGRTQVSGWGSTQGGQSWASPREENKNTSGKTFDKSKPSHGVEDQQLGNNSNSTMESNLSSSLQRKNANTARDWSKRADPVNSNVASQSDWDQELVSQKLTPKKATNQNISSNQQNRKFTTTPYATSSYNKDNNNNNQKQSDLSNSQGSDNINKGKDEHNLHNYTGSTTPQSEMSGITGYGGRSGIEKDDGSRSSKSSINSGNNNNNNKSGEEESVADQLSKAVSQVIGRSETNTASTGEGNPNTVLGALKTGAEKTVEFASNIKKKAMDMVDTFKNEFSSEQSPSSSNKSESSSLGPDMMYGRNTASNKQSQEKKENSFDNSTAAFDQVFGSDIKPDENTLSKTKRVPPGSQSNDLGTTTGTTRGINQGGSTGSSGLGSTGSGFGGSSSSSSSSSPSQSSPSQSSPSQSSSSSIPSGRNSNSDWNKI